MTNALTVYQDGGFELIQRSAAAMAASGYFSDARQQAQAIVKVMAGAELGIPPFAAMTGIHVIQGKPTLGANLIATLIKQHPSYDYRVKRLDDTICEIQFYEHGKPSGVSSFSADDARRVGVKNMGKFPRNMLFARAISNGARWYAPDVFGGSPVYTPDEMGAEVDEAGNVIEGEYSEPEPVRPEPEPEQQPEPQRQPAASGGGQSHSNGNGNGGKMSRPMTAEQLREAMRVKTARDSGTKPAPNRLTYARSSLSSVTAGNDQRHGVTEYLFGVRSTNDLTSAQCEALIQWIGYRPDDNDEWKPNGHAIEEAARAWRAAQIEQGQAEMPLFADEPDAPNGAYQ